MATTYVDQLKALSPEAYAKIAQLASFTANENYGGEVQDYQAQIFTPLSADVFKDVPKKASNTSDFKVLSRGAGFTKSLGEVNGIPIVARYSRDGNLTGFEGPQGLRSFINGSNSVSGKWDLSGNPVPQTWSSSGGGFLGEVIGGLAGGLGEVLGSIKEAISDAYMDVRDPLEAAAVVAGNYFVPGSSLLTSQLVSDDAKEILATDLGKAAVIGSGLAGSGAFSDAPVGSATGADNIDIGGGWSPATGATEAELASARAALEGVVATPIPDANIVETVLPSLPDAAVNDVLSSIVNEPQYFNLFENVPTDLVGPVQNNIANAADNIDVGGGFNPATGTGDLATATAAASNLPILSVDTIINDIANAADNIDVGGGYNPATGTGDLATAEAAAANPPVLSNVDTVINNITGNADRAALNSNAGYGDTLTSAQITAFDAAVAGGMSVADALNYVRAGLLVNALTGDPLGLNDSGGGGGGTTGSTGFAQVPIPAEWKSPTYATPAAPIDLNSLFTDMNLLGGTQWQGLVNQKPNLSFNDIFASGKQQTPMGTPVNINQIVSNILGQNTAS